jgi:hypothetical protein
MHLNPRALALVGVIAVGMAPAVVALAHAEDTPTSMELLEKCDDGTDSCTFHPIGSPRVFWNTTDMVGQTANCTNSNQEAAVSWTTTTTSSNSIGGSLKVIVGATKAFLDGFKIAYSHEWTETKSDADTTKISIPAGHMGRVYHAREMEAVNGQYEMHFRSRYHGHYYWYVPFTMTSPKGDGNDNVTTESAPLTADEKAAFCG